MQQEHCVIIGGSHAAAQVVSSLRLNKWEGKITIVSADAFLPYHRPPLSKSYLSGEKNLEEILIRPPTFFERSEVEVILGTRVTAIDRAAKKVHLDNQTDLPYTKLVITTGAKVRKINIPGHNLPGVFYLRDLNDVDHIREFLGHAKDTVIIGGGYTGLAAASALPSIDMYVTVLEALPRVLHRVTAPEVTALSTRAHGAEVVRILCTDPVQAIDGRYKVESVTCADGQV